MGKSTGTDPSIITEPKTIRWGIIGCGAVTEVKSGPGFQKADHSELVAVMRRNGDLARDYAERHGVPRWYDQAEALILDPDVDAIYIATPPAFHKPYVLQASATGKPVYVEKPMALNGSECDDMIASCESAGVPLFVAYYRRALPRFLKIKELLDHGTIGDIRLVTTQYLRPALKGSQRDPQHNWRVDPAQAGGGLLLDVGSHTLDILDFLLGPVKSVQGHASSLGHLYPAEDTVTGIFTYESGVHGIASWCFSASTAEDRNEMIGSLGKISFSTFGDDPIELVTAGTRQVFEIANPLHIQLPLIQSIVNELNGGPPCPSTGLSAARTSRVMDSLLKDYYARH
ncbi:MAG: Gfo/Idh/MocA family oxidoreductase [Clostridia bacterium]|nr:Gfo/Idh/MocA family oxidoreductase [Clostridia bacterium]NCC75500.1 Gfo/Idh/MocA family oxidoreductase [Clostridia bacterium]